MKIYEERRNLFCSLLTTELSDYLSFDVPKGGMAIWVKLNSNYSWDDVKKEGVKYNFSLGDWKRYDLARKKHNAIRMGFASFNLEEIRQLIEKLKKILITLEK